MRNMILFGVLSVMFILQTGCMQMSKKVGQPAVAPVALKVKPAGCNYDPLDYYNVSPFSAKAGLLVKPDEGLTQNTNADCSRLREAIMLSMPGHENQDDSKALGILQQLKQSDLPESHLRFRNQLFQHVLQRQQLRKMIEAQKKRLLKSSSENKALKDQLDTLQSQLNQLKNIEVEIEKKERSVVSPISE